MPRAIRGKCAKHGALQNLKKRRRVHSEGVETFGGKWLGAWGAACLTAVGGLRRFTRGGGQAKLCAVLRRVHAAVGRQRCFRSLRFIARLCGSFARLPSATACGGACSGSGTRFVQ